MAVKTYKRIKIDNTTFIPGEFYRFEYIRYENDRYPLIFYINTKFGYNEDTGNLHQYIQGINFHYIPRNFRIKFVKRWMNLNENNDYVFRYFNIFWNKLVLNFPYLSPAFRRYIYYPENIILKPQHIKKVDLEKIIVGSINRDFSGIEKLAFISKLRDFNKIILNKKGNKRLW